MIAKLLFFIISLFPLVEDNGHEKDNIMVIIIVTITTRGVRLFI